MRFFTINTVVGIKYFIQTHHMSSAMYGMQNVMPKDRGIFVYGYEWGINKRSSLNQGLIHTHKNGYIYNK